MPRRQPYQQTAPMGAPSEPVKEDAFETEEGGLHVTLSDADFAPSEPSTSDPAPITEAPQQAPEPQREQPRSADDEAFIRLKAQLERSERERLEAQSHRERAEKERSTVEGDLRTEREHAEQLRREYLETQKLAIENAMRVAEREASAAEDAIQRSLEAADYASAAKAQRILAQADNDLARLREGKLALETEKSRPVPQARTAPEAPVTQVQAKEPQTEWERVEAYITQPAHPPRVQEYMRQHYDDLFSNNGARINKLVAAHYDAKSQGLAEFSDQYFKAVDRHMGYDKSEQQPPAPAAREQPRPRAAIPPAAPVSRGSATDTTSGTSVTLTPAQVQFCRESNIDPKVYARQILTINKGASNPNYTGPRWTRDMGA
jgi:hypothetical protein